MDVFCIRRIQNTSKPLIVYISSFVSSQFLFPRNGSKTASQNVPLSFIIESFLLASFTFNRATLLPMSKLNMPNVKM
jgi:hypothetical protein